jgi:hypothetical protein
MHGSSPSSDYVYWLNDLPAEEMHQAGGKAGTLAHLRQAGYPVPCAFVILPPAFAGDDLKAEAWEEIEARIEDLRTRTATPSHGQGQGDAPRALAIRSSAVAEDSARTSFAGEFETVLHVLTNDELWEAIRAVRCSRHSERVRAYAQAQGAPQVQEMAVIVQQLVQPELSGVLFTADPVTGSKALMHGNYVPGLGEKLVSGEAPAREFQLSRLKGAYQGPPEMKTQAQALFQMAQRLEQDLGSPQDIEWAICASQVYLLQSRPITTLQGRDPATGEFNDSLTGDYLWSNVNFGEAVAEVMTPLSWSVLELTLEEWTVVPGYPPAGNIGGLPYLNLSSYASIFRALGMSEQKLLENLEGTLFTRLPEGMEIPPIPLSGRERLSILPRALQFEFKQRQAVRKLPGYLQANASWCQRMWTRISQAREASRLITLWLDEIEPHLRYSVWPVLGSASHAASHTTALHRTLVELVGPDDADALTSNLSQESELLESLGPLVGLAKVARGAMERDAYLARYGHRGPAEFELAAPRPAEEPNWLDAQLALLDAGTADVDALLAARRAQFDAAWQRLYAAHPKKARVSPLPLARGSPLGVCPGPVGAA